MKVYNSSVVLADKKLKAGNKSVAHAQIRHSLRSDYDTNKHSNPSIDASRTKNNILLVGGVNGLHAAGVDAIAEAQAYYDYQIKEAKPKRKDAIAGRYGVVEIDPCYWRAGSGDVDEFVDTGIEFLKDYFDERNLVFVAVHLDETNPHIQFLVTVRDYETDGKFRQKKWFAGADSYQKMQNACRKFYMENSNIPTDLSRARKHDTQEPEEYIDRLLAAKENTDEQIEDYINNDYAPKRRKRREKEVAEEIEREISKRVDDSEIVRRAQARAESILREAEEDAIDRKADTDDFLKRYRNRGIEDVDAIVKSLQVNADKFAKMIVKYDGVMSAREKEQAHKKLQEMRALATTEGAGVLPPDVWHGEDDMVKDESYSL